MDRLGRQGTGIGGGFTLIELLVVVVMLAVLIALFLPALAGAKEAGRRSVCLSNLRQGGIACQQYADESKGRGPAVGQPYTSWPTWALVVQTYSGRGGTSSAELYSTRSVLVCPTIAAAYRQQPMVRTYAMNATGHAGLAGDRDNYDDAAHPAFIRMDCVLFPSTTPVLLDSDVPPTGTTDPPPPTRTAAMIDFRQPTHVETRLGRFHGRRFQTVMFDLSACVRREVVEGWSTRLP